MAALIHVPQWPQADLTWPPAAGVAVRQLAVAGQAVGGRRARAGAPQWAGPGSLSIGTRTLTAASIRPRGSRRPARPAQADLDRGGLGSESGPTGPSGFQIQGRHSTALRPGARGPRPCGPCSPSHARARAIGHVHGLITAPQLSLLVGSHRRGAGAHAEAASASVTVPVGASSS